MALIAKLRLPTPPSDCTWGFASLEIRVRNESHAGHSNFTLAVEIGLRLLNRVNACLLSESCAKT